MGCMHMFCRAGRPVFLRFTYVRWASNALCSRESRPSQRVIIGPFSSWYNGIASFEGNRKRFFLIMGQGRFCPLGLLLGSGGRFDLPVQGNLLLSSVWDGAFRFTVHGNRLRFAFCGDTKEPVLEPFGFHRSVRERERRVGRSGDVSFASSCCFILLFLAP